MYFLTSDTIKIVPNFTRGNIASYISIGSAIVLGILCLIIGFIVVKNLIARTQESTFVLPDLDIKIRTQSKIKIFKRKFRIPKITKKQMKFLENLKGDLSEEEDHVEELILIYKTKNSVSIIDSKDLMKILNDDLIFEENIDEVPIHTRSEITGNKDTDLFNSMVDDLIEGD